MSGSILTRIDNKAQSPFDSIRRFDGKGNEYWLARELQKLLGYTRWEKFDEVINRVVKSIELQNQDPLDHIRQTENMIAVGKGGNRSVIDFTLTRYACYLVAMSGDNSKPEIAQAQSYFALKTREAETIIPAQNEALRFLELENENLRLKHQRAAEAKTLIPIYGEELALTMLGFEPQVLKIETLVTEVVQPETGRCDRILTADQLKSEIRRKTGQNIKSMKFFVDKLKANGRDDLLKPVPRSYTSEYVDPDRLDEAIAVVYGKERQELIKPVAVS
jgi:hypothetical protein